MSTVADRAKKRQKEFATRLLSLLREFDGFADNPNNPDVEVSGAILSVIFLRKNTPGSGDLAGSVEVPQRAIFWGGGEFNIVAAASIYTHLHLHSEHFKQSTLEYRTPAEELTFMLATAEAALREVQREKNPAPGDVRTTLRINPNG